MVVNTNDQVSVRLTDTGMEILRQHWGEHFDGVCRHRLSPDGEYTESLWQIMRIFGPSIHLGMGEVPFVGNVVNIPETTR